MTNRYYFLGHETLSNRGCEALVRGISSIIYERSPDAEFLVPSFNVENDSKQWVAENEHQVSFISAYKMPLYVRIWGKLDRTAPQLSRLCFPSPSIPKDIQQYLNDTTAGILTGGDVLSLEYGIPSLLKFLGQAESYMADKITYAIAASSGQGTLTKAQAIKQLEYLNNGTKPWNFNIQAATITKYKAGAYSTYLNDDVIFGVSGNKYFVSFHLDSNNKIDQFFISSSTDIL